jgi:hypothetical protein
MKRAILLMTLVSVAIGCSQPKGVPVTQYDPAPQPLQQTAAQREEAKRIWIVYPNFSRELLLSRTGRPLEDTLPTDFVGDPSDKLFPLEGVMVDGAKPAVRLTDIGSGIHITVVSLYLLDGDEWKIAYRLTGAVSLVDHPVDKAEAKGLDLELSYDWRDTHWSEVVPLPGDVESVATG